MQVTQPLASARHDAPIRVQVDVVLRASEAKMQREREREEGTEQLIEEAHFCQFARRVELTRV